MPNSGSQDPTDPLSRVGAPGSVTPSETVDAADAASESTGIDGSEAAGAPDSTDAVAQALANGAIDPETARARLIDAAVRARMPQASSEAIAAVRAEVEALVGSDPILDRLLRP